MLRPIFFASSTVAKEFKLILETFSAVFSWKVDVVRSGKNYVATSLLTEIVKC